MAASRVSLMFDVDVVNHSLPELAEIMCTQRTIITWTCLSCWLTAEVAVTEALTSVPAHRPSTWCIRLEALTKRERGGRGRGLDKVISASWIRVGMRKWQYHVLWWSFSIDDLSWSCWDDLLCESDFHHTVSPILCSRPTLVWGRDR